MKKFGTALLTAIVVFSLCIPVFATSNLKEMQEDANQFIDSINEQYDTYYSLTITSDELSPEKIQNLKDSISEMAKHQKEIKDQLREFEMNPSNSDVLPYTKAGQITKRVSANVHDEIKDEDGFSHLFDYEIFATVTYSGRFFSKVTSIDSKSLTPKLDWKQRSGTGYIFEDGQAVNISATGDFHYISNGFRLDGPDHTISAPIYIEDII